MDSRQLLILGYKIVLPWKALIVLSSLAFGLFSCTHGPSNPFAGDKPANRISIMSYNVENLFDTEHDVGKEDYTFLPLNTKRKLPEVEAYCQKQKGGRKKECQELDWSPSLLEKKIQNVAGSILQVYGEGPDILMLVEVENLKVLSALNKKGLKEARYITEVLIEGEDERGIDVALLTRYPLAGTPSLHPMVWQKALDMDPRPTRGILQVPLKIAEGEVLNVFVVHFPSQGAPVEFRMDGVSTVANLVTKVPKGQGWVVGGDWNITEEEELKYQLVSKDLAGLGSVSHLVGCKKCRGTHNYRKDWSFLDMLVFSPQFLNAEHKGRFRLVPDSITTPKWGLDQTEASGRPKRFDPKKREGVADHFPIYAELELQSADHLERKSEKRD